LYSRIIEEDIKYILSQTDNLKFLQGKTLFITGVNGLIASWLVETVYYANKINKKPISLFGIYRSDSDRLSHIEDDSIHLTKEDVKYHHLIEADYVLHLACNSSPDYFTKHPIETIETNINSTNWLALDTVAFKGTLIYFSTGEVYGHPDVVPTPESYEGKSLTSDIRSGYIESKRCSEALCWAFHRELGLNFKILRPFIVYGPGYRKDDLRVIPTFIRSALHKNVINIRSDGSETRAFAYISDAIVQIMRLLAIKHSDCYNVGSQAEIAISELARVILIDMEDNHSIGVNLKIGKEPPTGALRVCPDMSKTLKAINYTNKYTLNEGINRTIDYFREKGVS